MPNLTVVDNCAHKMTCTRKQEQLEGALPASKHIVIFGLGNPGSAYSLQRHNLGFMVVDELARQTRGSWKKELKTSETCRTQIEGSPVTLVKPQTFMNLSGKAVAPLLNKLHCDPAVGLIVIHDDMDIAFGRVRIKVGGGAGGHKGVRSTMDSLRFSDFIRVRMGVGRPPAHIPPEVFVLSGFSPEEKPIVSILVEAGCRAVRFIVGHGVERAQNLLHSEKDENGSKAVVS